MGENGKHPDEFFDPLPEVVGLEDNRWLQLSIIGSRVTDISYLPRPLDTIEDEPDGTEPDAARTARNSYIAMCESKFAALWRESELFVDMTALENRVELGDSTLFDTHLAFDELIQNAFRHGSRPQRLSINLVEARELQPAIPLQTYRARSPHRQVPQLSAMAGYRVLVGVQDPSPSWKEQSPRGGDELPENLRGLDIVRGVSRALWHQSDGPSSKWVWTLI